MDMKKGLLLGSVLGGAAAYLAFRTLDAEKEAEIRKRILESAEDAKDRAVDYAFYAADALADAREMVNDKVTDYKDSLSDTSTKVNAKLNDLKDDLSQLQDYLNTTPVPKDQLAEEEKGDESDDITVDMDDAFSPKNDGDDPVVPPHADHQK
ncbi:hypothetical protein [Fructilactobacillus carniphilus]|uniref:YtxH domain-containing protein n=1 Tax=Fructilactobacillus carniphilus TaxID=2940297 RepID=A0ABY5BZL2_9LACO|nr:hypothetical protein [Fructilactobacillus carniphilus]USS91229.1 hypothetical protein M3M37_03260 [Fructilactobacillus carniphilus]